MKLSLSAPAQWGAGQVYDTRTILRYYRYFRPMILLLIWLGLGLLGAMAMAAIAWLARERRDPPNP